MCDSHCALLTEGASGEIPAGQSLHDLCDAQRCVLGGGRWCSEERAALFELMLAVPVGEQAEVADPHEATWQYVQ